MFANLGWTEILIVGGGVLLLFGAKRFPEIGRSIGQGLNNFIRGIKGAFDDDAPKLPPTDADDNRLSR